MTTIFWHKNHLYADSNVVQGEESFQSLTKVKRFAQPVAFTHKESKTEDEVYGWISTGALQPAEKFMQLIYLFGSVDAHALVYEFAGRLGLVNFENFFEVIIIGRKANYSFSLAGEKGCFKTYEHKEGFVLGSGAGVLRELIQAYPKFDPVRLMYTIYCRDRNSSGLVDVWKLSKPKGKPPSLDRVGICRGLEGRDVASLIADITAPYPFDWRLNPRAEQFKAVSLHKQESARFKGGIRFPTTEGF